MTKVKLQSSVVAVFSGIRANHYCAVVIDMVDMGKFRVTAGDDKQANELGKDH